MDKFNEEIQMLEDMISKEKLKKKSKESRLIYEIQNIICEMADSINDISASQICLERQLESMDESVSDIINALYDL